uniref:DUF19 domain-containing protein n=1 Tax=Panagrellus redivivus TaxID=6233 RepID=A0A7E4VHT2_PANRE
MSNFVFVALACLLAVSAFTDAAACGDANKFKLCYNKYMESFDVGTSPWPEYRAFKMIREVLLVEKGPAGQTVECNYQNELISCLGDLAADCVSTDNFVSTFAVSTADAANYVEDYYMMQYTCNDGFQDAIKYFYCMEQVGLYYVNKLEKCSSDKAAALQSNPNDCTAYNTFVTCMVDAFVSHCGADITKYMCNLEVDGAVAAVPQCKSQIQTCPTTYNFVDVVFKPTYTRKQAMRQAFQRLQRGGQIFP